MEAGSKEIKLGMRRKEEHRQQREKKDEQKKLSHLSSNRQHKADPTIWPSFNQEASIRSIRECSRDCSQLQGTAQDLGDLQDGKPGLLYGVVEMSLSKVGVSGYIAPLGLLPVCIGRQRAASGWCHGANKRSVGTP
ncbi:predicted protein [Histoplasma mississippiense (nom. inval.)]|uniref:predicted protein n=1 Tax=Ajellomyces capsulatus (strain NAm1 / WU24) TaxID=2059318 RepID=UPI000157B7C3|nr:predicted protein [Histoplasma mississippiense (nom. inval.)]EDN03458.1 predicted protein [Histoplasma mississippiense (nom. inval.)]